MSEEVLIKKRCPQCTWTTNRELSTCEQCGWGLVDYEVVKINHE